MLARWPERIGGEATEESIRRLFKNGHYTVLEPAWQGRLIVSIKDMVFVVSRTNTTLVIHTVYGLLSDYDLKRPHAAGSYEEIELAKWERHQHKKQTRLRGGVV